MSYRFVGLQITRKSGGFKGAMGRERTGSLRGWEESAEKCKEGQRWGHGEGEWGKGWKGAA